MPTNGTIYIHCNTWSKFSSSVIINYQHSYMHYYKNRICMIKPCVFIPIYLIYLEIFWEGQFKICNNLKYNKEFKILNFIEVLEEQNFMKLWKETNFAHGMNIIVNLYNIFYPLVHARIRACTNPVLFLRKGIFIFSYKLQTNVN